MGRHTIDNDESFFPFNPDSEPPFEESLEREMEEQEREDRFHSDNPDDYPK